MKVFGLEAPPLPLKLSFPTYSGKLVVDDVDKTWVPRLVELEVCAARLVVLIRVETRRH